MSGMKTNFLPTNEYYHLVLAEPDPVKRTQLYLDLLVQPWSQMMSAFAGRTGGGEDPLAGARAWNWLLPDQVDQIEDLLAKLEAADAWKIGAEALARGARCFEPYAGQIPFDTVSGWLVLGDPARSNAFEQGYTGATDWFQPRFIGQFWQPDETNLSRLPSLVVHEFHHLVRLRAFPFGMDTSVADYIVIEGTAEAFAASLYGADKAALVISQFDPAGLEPARRLIGAGLEQTGFDAIRGYIFGDTVASHYNIRPVGGMPTYGGYIIGFQVVQAFLERSGLSIEEATFLPAREIIAGSKYFD